MSSPIDDLFYNYGNDIPPPPNTPATTDVPVWCFYDSVEDLIMDSSNGVARAMEELPDPPIKIEDISGTQQLLDYIAYIEEHQLYDMLCANCS